MKRPESGWGIDSREVHKYFIKAEEEIRKIMMEAINKATTPKETDTAIERANVLHYHLIWKDFAKNYGFEYTKIKSLE